MPAGGRLIHLHFPLGGLDRRGSYRRQPPFTTPSALNVRPFEALDGRARGGTRPGIGKAYGQQLGDGKPVRLLAKLSLVKADGFTITSEGFTESGVGDAWSVAPWNGPLPKPWPEDESKVDWSLEETAAVYKALTNFSALDPYTIELFCAPYKGSFHGKYRLYGRMDNDNPDVTWNGITAELEMTAGTGAYTGRLRSVVNGVVTEYPFASGTTNESNAGWFSLVVTGNNVQCFWKGRLLLSQTVSAHPGQRMGFGLNATNPGGVCLAGSFRSQYYSVVKSESKRAILCASAGGEFWREKFVGFLEKLETDVVLSSDKPLYCAERGQKLYIADWDIEAKATGVDGTLDETGRIFDAASVPDWTELGIDINTDVVVIHNATGAVVNGTYAIESVSEAALTLKTSAGGAGGCAFSVERGPLIYDGLTDNLSVWTGTVGKGGVPAGCGLICRYRDRIVLAKHRANPHVWYMSRQGDPDDWDYGADPTDAQRAVAGQASEAGAIADTITALVPHTDDYLVFGALTSLWVLRGDATYGGQLNALSRTVGVMDGAAWCHGPNGELIFVSREGLYMLAPGAQAYPESISRDRLPWELRDLDPRHRIIVMAYDARDMGIHICPTVITTGGTAHWWLDWRTKTYWNVSLPTNIEPTAILATTLDHLGSVVLLGCRDGYLRYYHEVFDGDDGKPISSHVIYGPIVPTENDSRETVVMELVGEVAQRSGPIRWALMAGNVVQRVPVSEPNARGTWNAGLNAPARPRARGLAFALRVENESQARWAIERAHAIIRPAGRARI